MAEREALKQESRQKAEAIRSELKERYRPQWAALYKKQREDRRDVANARRSVLASMRVAIKERRRLTPEGRPGIGTILAYGISARSLSDALAAAEQRELAALRDRMAEDRRGMVKAVWDEYSRDFAALRQTQAEARKAQPRETRVVADQRADELARQQAEKERAGKTAAEREAEQREQARREKSGPVRLELPEVSDPTALPPADEATRRREALKAEFRRQADEITRRRKERHKKDRDRDRER